MTLSTVKSKIEKPEITMDKSKLSDNALLAIGDFIKTLSRSFDYHTKSAADKAVEAIKSAIESKEGNKY